MGPAVAHEVLTMATTTITTTYGPLRGTLEDGVTVFRGIPYARPPVGPLRFAPPQPPAPWSGVREATAFGPPALQAANPVTGQDVFAAPSEDCLMLNVWTPGPDARTSSAVSNGCRCAGRVRQDQADE
jgi:para-nitrobenzyl esterase